MVGIKTQTRTVAGRHRAAGSMLIAELVVAMGIVVAVLVPLSIGFVKDAHLLRAGYYRAVAMEIVDGEMETLVSGEWQAYSEGTHEYKVSARAAANLPRGKFVLTRTGNRLRLEWSAASARGIGRIVREATVK